MSTEGTLKRSASAAAADEHSVEASSSQTALANGTRNAATMTAQAQDAPGLHLDVQAVKAELTCNICLDLPHRVATVLPCLHSFCWTCVQEWFKTHSKCPRCAQVGTEAKPNPALTNLAQLLEKYDPSFSKPQDLVRQEDAAFAEYKVSHGSSARIIPCRSLYDDESDDEDEDMVPPFWPCPCCDNGNRSGYTCPNPIRPFQALPPGVQQQPPPPRGSEWPELDIMADHAPFFVITSHTSCTMCTRWIPSQGVPEAKCSGCRAYSCSPYDEDGLCPQALDVYSPLMDHPAIRDALEADDSNAYPPTSKLNQAELTRLKTYMADNQITAGDVYREAIEQAEAVLAAAQEAGTDSTDTAEVVAPTTGADAEGSAGTQTQAAAAQGGADAPQRPQISTEEIECLVSPDHICQDSCTAMTIAKAHNIKEALYCECCAIEALRNIVDRWWTDIRRNKKDTLPAAVRDLEDCWYGRECRTQFYRPEHAQRYNHICNNTKPEAANRGN